MLMESGVPPTRVGVLLLDSLDEPHRTIAGDYDELYANVLSEGSSTTQAVFFDGRGELPSHDACDGWIIPGSRASVYDDEPWVHNLQDWTAEALDNRVPLAGICFGHQMVAKALGTPVGKADVGWNIGAIDYTVHSQPTHVAPVPEQFRLLASHQDQVAHLPDGATLFASSEGCPIAGYSIEDNVLCVQGHPEFVPELAASLYWARADRIGVAPVEIAMTTLDRPLDRGMVAGWLTDTIRRTATVEVA